MNSYEKTAEMLYIHMSIFYPELSNVLSDVFIYEEEQKDGRILRGLRFKFPIYMNGRKVLGVDWDNESTDETVCLLNKRTTN